MFNRRNLTKRARETQQSEFNATPAFTREALHDANKEHQLRSQDVERLSEHFSPEPDPQIESELRLGPSIPNAHRLAALIHDDLAVGPPYGVRWWATPGTE